MSKRFRVLATLGDPPINHLTSSYYVAEKRKLADEIAAFESFEAAIQEVLEGRAEVALIAGAYPKIRDFIMNRDLVCTEAFVEQIPPLVACGVQVDRPLSVETVYLHPATIPLLPQLQCSFVNKCETSATSAAASRAQHDSNSVAICNKLAADYYNLKVHQTLLPALQMPFALFVKGAS